MELDLACRRARTKGLRSIARLLLYVSLVELFRNGIIAIPYPSVASRVAAGFRYVLLVFTIIDLAAMKLMGEKLVTNLITVHPPDEEWPERNNAVQKIYLMEVIYLLISELAAVYGLIIFYISGGNAAYFYTFWLLSVVLIGIHFPRLDHWQEKLAKY